MRKIISTALIALLAACGGGGGDSGGGGGTTPLGAPLVMTSSNYVAATQEAVLSWNSLQRSGGLVTGVQVSSDPAVIRAMLDQIDRLGHWFSRGNALVTGVTTTETEACNGGGTLTATINDQNGNEEADPGDSVVIVASNCVLAGYTVNGTIRLLFDSVTGVFGEAPYSARLTMTAENFNVATAAGNSTGNGHAEVEIAASSADSGSISISTNDFKTVGSSQTTRTLSNFSVRATTARIGNTSTVSTTLNGGVTSTALDSKSVTVSTVRPLLTVLPDIYPRSGQLIVAGAANSKARLTVQSSTTVLIELDADGDGSYEASTSRRWSDFV